jgi:hypothetical protein
MTLTVFTLTAGSMQHEPDNFSGHSVRHPDHTHIEYPVDPLPHVQVAAVNSTSHATPTNVASLTEALKLFIWCRSEPGFRTTI